MQVVNGFGFFNKTLFGSNMAFAKVGIIQREYFEKLKVTVIFKENCERMSTTGLIGGAMIFIIWQNGCIYSFRKRT